jgi:formylglycine-generating enzyme required for sulfatase activity
MRAAFAPILLVALISAAQAKPLDHFRDCPTCPEMIELPLGDFTMGTPDGAGGPAANPDSAVARGNEGHAHKVTVDLPIAMSRNEITFDDYMACVKAGACSRLPKLEFPGGGTAEQVTRAVTDPRFKHTPFEKAIAEDNAKRGWVTLWGNSPAIGLTYFDAKTYTDWLNRTLGTLGYRLPTEAEWEYAARAGTTTPFAQGIEATADQVNINGPATEVARGAPQPQLRLLGYPMPVDEMDAANPWGLRHMSGNAGEITMSCYLVDPERIAPRTKTSEWLANDLGQSCPRVERGGSYGSSMDAARVSSREGILEDQWYLWTGFRIVKDLPAPGN